MLAPLEFFRLSLCLALSLSGKSGFSFFLSIPCFAVDGVLLVPNVGKSVSGLLVSEVEVVYKGLSRSSVAACCVVRWVSVVRVD